MNLLSLPPNVQSVVDEALSAVRADPKHEMGFKRRQALWAAFKAADEVIGQKANGWCAVLAARRVLPIYEEAELPVKAWRSEPRGWLNLAEQVLRDQTDIAEASRRSSDIHYEVGNMNEMAYDDGLQNMSVGCALQAAHLALSESVGTDHLAALGSSFKISDGEITSVETTDEAMAIRGFAGDTLASAAYAYAIDYIPIDAEEFAGDGLVVTDDFEENDIRSYLGNSVNRPRLLEFWEWWLTDAIPAAWKAAQGTAGQ